ncbi:invasion associated locus B family protein [Tateyamaria armeniaca]|uniref:Invasion associated locus B family protein n=1 Tax=Tateyamaria armeniaca TaxID=2518930 RepID=A0ABW8USP0_9RHOB
MARLFKVVRNPVLSSVLASLLVFGIPLASQGQDGTGDWQAICDELGCRLAQSLVAPRSETTVLMARVYDSQTPTLVLTVPLGAFLKPGILLSIDGDAPRAFAYEICDEFGCHAGVPMDDGLLRDFRRGLKADVAFVDGAQEQISVSLSLVGFTNGMKALAGARVE